MGRVSGVVILIFVAAAEIALFAQTPPSKSDIVMVAGCLKEQPANTWRLVNALDPTPSNAVAPPANELPAMPVVGTRQFHLIGVSVFDLPSYRDHTVAVKGLLIPATPVSRLNVTSVVRIAPSCATPK
jgi:hypothetical protein